MRFQNFLNEEKYQSEIVAYMKKLIGKPIRSVADTFRDAWAEISATLSLYDLEKEALKIINKNMDTNYSSLEQIDRLKKPVNEEVLNEGWSHWWEKIKMELFPTLAFYPALTTWFELDKLLRGNPDFSGRIVALYASFWLLLVSGKYISEFKKWKKENPEKFEKEKEQGLQGVIPRRQRR